MQKEAAKQIGVDKMTLLNWESNRASPAIRHRPMIRRFLNEAEFQPSGTLANRLKSLRETFGYSQARLAAVLGIDEGTIRRWERESGKIQVRKLKVVEAMMARLSSERQS